MAESRYCIDCLNNNEGTCNRVAISEISLVTGQRRELRPRFDAHFERYTKDGYWKSNTSDETIELCGREGKFFEPKGTKAEA